MNPIAAKIKDAELKIVRLEQQLAELRIFKRGLEAALSAVTPDSSGAATKSSDSGGGRGLSQAWREILRFIGSDGKTIDDVVKFARDRGTPVERNNVRSQVSNMVNKSGLLERLGSGVFRLTEKGALACGAAEEEGPSASTDGPSELIPPDPPLVASERTRNVEPGEGGPSV
jgi:hypothetical protein